MSNLRLPTMRQLERMGVDAGKALDAIEYELEKEIKTVKPSYRKNIKAAIHRVQKRRAEFFGDSELQPENGQG